MGPSKKKQIVRSAVTLHDFFKSGAASLQRDKIRSTLSNKGTRSPRQNGRTVSPQDIIVIDSDSGDEPILSRVQGASGTKRRRLSESSNEVEFVDQLDSEVRLPKSTAPRASKRSTKSRSRDGLPKVSTMEPLPSSDEIIFSESTNVATSQTQEEAGFLSFGAPSLLFPIPAQPPLFSPPTLLSSTSDLHQPPSPPTSDAQSLRTSISDDNFSNMDFEFSTNSLDEDWGMGDDEAAFEPSAGDNGDDIYDLTNPAILDLSTPARVYVSATTSINASNHASRLT